MYNNVVYRNRIDASSLDSTVPSVNLSEIDYTCLLMTSTDESLLLQDAQVSLIDSSQVLTHSVEPVLKLHIICS